MPLEEEEDGEGEPQKYRQLEEDEEEEMETGENELTIRAVQEETWEQYWDDLSGKALNPKLVA